MHAHIHGMYALARVHICMRTCTQVLASPTCVIQSLTLESNPISSAGIEALASALPSNSSLKELKMRNLLARVSKEVTLTLTLTLTLISHPHPHPYLIVDSLAS